MEYLLKACVCSFLSNSYFFTKCPPKTMNNFISSKKFLSFTRYSNFCYFPFLSALPSYKWTNESGIIYDVMNWLAEICRCNF